MTEAFRKRFAAGDEPRLRCEAASLARLKEFGVRVPEVLSIEKQCLVLEYVPQGIPTDSAWRDVALQVARTHAVPGERFGFSETTWCGPTPQCNVWSSSWRRFFVQQRLLPLWHQVRARGWLDSEADADFKQVEVLCHSLLPEDEPRLLHGDLWFGNVLFDPDERAWLIDPALYFGLPEADLAMLLLFGDVSPIFLATYEAMAPWLRPDWRERVPLYQLYHLLNHLLLFGKGYLAPVRRTLRRLRSQRGPGIL
jgi:fructosamine-3-kinase